MGGFFGDKQPIRDLGPTFGWTIDVKTREFGLGHKDVVGLFCLGCSSRSAHAS